MSQRAHFPPPLSLLNKVLDSRVEYFKRARGELGGFMALGGELEECGLARPFCLWEMEGIPRP